MAVEKIPEGTDLYKLLKLKPDAFNGKTPDEVTAFVRNAAKKAKAVHHPDKIVIPAGADPATVDKLTKQREELRDKFNSVTVAEKIMSDENWRQQYDQIVKTHGINVPIHLDYVGASTPVTVQTLKEHAIPANSNLYDVLGLKKADLDAMASPAQRNRAVTLAYMPKFNALDSADANYEFNKQLYQTAKKMLSTDETRTAYDTHIVSGGGTDHVVFNPTSKTFTPDAAIFSDLTIQPQARVITPPTNPVPPHNTTTPPTNPVPPHNTPTPPTNPVPPHNTPTPPTNPVPPHNTTTPPTNPVPPHNTTTPPTNPVPPHNTTTPPTNPVPPHNNQPHTNAKQSRFKNLFKKESTEAKVKAELGAEPWLELTHTHLAAAGLLAAGGWVAYNLARQHAAEKQKEQVSSIPGL